jgi:putative toxin-antitoxin system antitoxin component (TIGR02293 family)
MKTDYVTDTNNRIQEVLGIDVVNKNISPNDFRLAIRNGFPFLRLMQCKKKLNLLKINYPKSLGSPFGPSLAGKKTTILDPIESDILYRVARVVVFAVSIFGDIEKARVWLKWPNCGLGGEIPLNLLSTDIDSHQVKELLERIKF